MQNGWKQTYPQPTITTTDSDVRLVTPSSSIMGQTSNQTIANAASLINLDDFWADSRFANIKGNGLTTVIIDTGIDLNHPFFGADNNNDGIADKILYQYDFADNDNNASDRNNHGSHVASIFTNVAPDANIIVLKVFSDSGSGSFSDLERALQWVSANADTYDVASVNLSLGDGRNWNTATSRYGIGDELAAIASQNIIISAAAGNSFYQYNSIPGLAYPAIDPNTISVGAVWTSNFGSQTFAGGSRDYTTERDRIASFSQRHPLLDVFAPGTLINGANANGGTIAMGGTSQAAPFISGIALLAQQIASEKLGRKLSVNEFRTLLDTTSLVINDGDNENDNVTNTGLNFPRIDLLALAQGILNFSGNNPDNNPSNPGNNSTDNPTNPSANNPVLPHTVTLDAGEIATGIDFGNQKLNVAPVIANPIPDITATEDAAFNFIFNENTFSDEGTLTYSATLENGDSLPSWLNFNANARTFSGTPGNAEVGTLNIKVTATDSQGEIASDTFTLTVENVNDKPILQNAIADQTTTENTIFSFTIPENAFSDVDTNDNLTYSATLDNGNPLPNWLSFNASTRTLSGIPGNNDSGILNIKITASDRQGATVSDIFALTVFNPINGNNTDNNLSGTSSPDLINGGSGNDYIEGLAGNDAIDGGTGKFDRMFGGSGNDTITDPDGILGAHGGTGNDKISVTFAASWDNDTNSTNAPRSDGKISGGYGDDNITVTMNNSKFFINLKGDESTNNVLDGNDRITLLGNYQNSIVALGGGNDTFIGGKGSDNVSGGTGNDILFGWGGNDNLAGNNGNDTLTGGAGNDNLTGGSGQDWFTFSSPGGDRSDRITDFNSTDDTIGVDDAGFGGGLVAGTLLASQFVLGTAAKDTSDRFIYNQSTGALFFDADGTGANAQTQIATLTTKSVVSFNDIVVI
jgi:Ca2+-binding RTX toxin-like protein